MATRVAGLSVLGLLLGPLLGMSTAAWPAQTGASHAGAAGAESRVGEEYTAQCWRHGLRCTLVYGEKPERPKRAPSIGPVVPIVDGPLAILLVVVGLVLAVGLWMRFGGGGVLLSSAPRELKSRRGDAPENWHSGAAEAEESSDQFLRRIAAMGDRRQALVQLLRRCLLHAADITGTRLFRYDTERAVLQRLPPTVPDRDRLETLLRETELVHYGGRVPAEPQFATLLAAARSLLSRSAPAHA